MGDTVKVSLDNRIALVTLNRPGAYNALDLELTDSFASTMCALATDDGVRGIVITGEGKGFCAGGDLKWVSSFPDGPTAAFHQLAARLHLSVTEIRRMAKPVIAAVNGPAAGAGFTLALACDFRVMDESAFFRQAYTSSGLCIDGGGTFTLPRMVGLARSLEIAAFDEPISAPNALEWGLVTRVCEEGRCVSEATAMALQIAGGSLHSFGLAKKLLTDSFETPFEAQIEREREGLCECGGHPEGLEGLAAFVEKRKPDFSGGTRA